MNGLVDITLDFMQLPAMFLMLKMVGNDTADG
jgi:hypothetical protein